MTVMAKPDALTGDNPKMALASSKIPWADLQELQDILQKGQREKSPILNRNVSVKRAKSPKQVTKLKGSMINKNSVVRDTSKLKNICNPYAQRQEVPETKGSKQREVVAMNRTQMLRATRHDSKHEVNSSLSPRRDESEKLAI